MSFKKIETIEEFVSSNCEDCGSSNAKLVVDPYALEIEGFIEHRYLCKNCLEQLSEFVAEEMEYEF